MDLEIKNLGETLAIGGFAVYSTLYLIGLCKAHWVPRFFAKTDGRSPLQHTAVYLALVFAAGIVLEDVSKSYAAERTKTLYPVINYALDSDRSIRLRSLFEVERLTETELRATPRNIFNELSKIAAPNKIAQEHLNVLLRLSAKKEGEQIILKTKDDVAAFLKAVNGVYYDAKNRVYQEESYFNELGSIENRVHFTRSLTFLGLVFAGIYLLFFGVVSAWKKAASVLEVSRPERQKVLLVGVLFLATIHFAGVAYRTESTHYDLRVFGYYIALTAEKTAVTANPSLTQSNVPN